MLSEADPGADPGVHPPLSEQAGRHAPRPAHRPRAPALRAVPGHGRDRRVARDHPGRSPRHDELLRLLPPGPDRRDARLGLPVALVLLTGGEEMLDLACSRLGISSGQTTADGKLTVEFAECLGICDFAPAALADDGRVFGPLDPEKVDAMIADLATRAVRPLTRSDRPHTAHAGRPQERPLVAEFEPVLTRNWNVPDGHTLAVYESRGGYQASRKALTTMSPDQVVERGQGLGAARPGRGGVPLRAEVEFPPEGSEGDPHVRQRRRERAGDVQQPAPDRARPAPVPRRDPHRLLRHPGVGGLPVPPLRVHQRLSGPREGDRRGEGGRAPRARTSTGRGSTWTSGCTAGRGRTSAARRPG